MKASLYCVYAGLLIMGGMWWKMFDELRDAQADVRELRAEVAALSTAESKNVEERQVSAEEHDIEAMDAVAEIAKTYAGTTKDGWGRERAMWHAEKMSNRMLDGFGSARALVDMVFERAAAKAE